MVNLRQRRVSNHNGKVQKGSFYLPPEIICEILSRLPVESILRCRSVCKEWCRLTRDPQFINLQLNRVNNQLPRVILKSHYKVDLQSLLLLDTEGCNIRKIPFKKMQLPSSPKFRMSDLRLMSSCDGLLCIAVDYRIHPVIILNPITRDSVILPSQKRRMYVGSHQIGLHFDPSSGKYKAVREYRSMNHLEGSSFEMITVGENSWRTLSAPPVPIEENLGAAVYWNGAFHWKIEEKNNKGGDKCILGFNISDETFYTISCHVKFGTSEYDLLVLGGCLSLVEHDVHLMRIWKVSGTKDEGFYLSHRCTYNTYVRWNKFLCYSVISQTVPDRFLLKLSQDDGKGDGNDSFVQFYPEKAFYSYLDIPGLPIHFRSVHFKPTFVSPRAASLGFS